MFYDEESNTTVIKWYPITGRTHQIRVHLKHIGYPIANDVNYGGILYNDFKLIEKPQESELKDKQVKEKDNAEEAKEPIINQIESLEDIVSNFLLISSTLQN